MYSMQRRKAERRRRCGEAEKAKGVPCTRMQEPGTSLRDRSAISRGDSSSSYVLALHSSIPASK
jgi:hypothetical protein